MDKPTTPPLRLLERPGRARVLNGAPARKQPQPWWQRWLARGSRSAR